MKKLGCGRDWTEFCVNSKIPLMFNFTPILKDFTTCYKLATHFLEFLQI
jgi:hypothetical protein